MKVRVTMEFNVVETPEGIEIHDDQGLCLTRKPTLKRAVDDIRAMVADTSLTDDLQVQIVDVIAGRDFLDKT